MKITQLTLRNFRSHRNTTFNFDRLNILRSPNGGGKSSVAMALEMLLTGRCDVTDAAGRGSEALITTGQQEMQVAARIDGNVQAQYIRNRAGTSFLLNDGGQHAGAHARERLTALTAATDVLASVLNAGRFVDLPEKDQRALLAGALASDPVDIAPEIAASLGAVLGGPQTLGTVHSAGDVDQLYKVVFDLRTQTGRDLKSLGDIAAPMIPEDCPALATVQGQITALGIGRDKLVRKRADKLAKYEAAKAAAELSGNKRVALEAEQKQCEAVLLTDAELTKLRKVADAQDAAAKLDAEITKTQNLVTEGRAALLKMREPQDDKCPTCGQAVAVEDRSGWISEREAQVTKAGEQLTAAQTKRTKLGDPDKAQEKLDAHRAAMARSLKIEAELKSAPAVASDPPSTTTEDDAIAALAQRLSAGRDVEKRVIEYEAAQREHAKLTAKRDALAKRQNQLNTLVEYFSDRGPLKTALVGDKLAGFRDRINDALTRFGFVCSFELEPYTLRVAAGAHDEGLALNQLSESERYRFGISFQVALAEATGVNLVVIDRADMLTVDARHELTTLLFEGSLDQAFVLATTEADAPVPDPIPPGVCFFQLSNNGDGTTVETFAAAPEREVVGVND